jgi:hypothetical protein
MDEEVHYPYKKKPKKRIGNILFWLVIIGIFSYLIFRTEINSAQETCISCSEPEDCQDICVSYCLSHFTDIITTNGMRNQSAVFCQCNCNSNLHVIVDRFL